MKPVLPFNPWIARFAGQPVLPSFYWNVYSYEQRIKEICLRLHRVIRYADYLGAHVNELIELVNNLSAKVEELNDEVTDLNKRLEEEIKRAMEAEKQLQDNIDAEAEARKEADQQLQANIDAEEEARKEADQQLQANIDAEQERAEQAEQQLQDNIDAEEQARQEADQQLQSNIDDLSGKLNKEIQDRKDGDNNLQSQIDAINAGTDVVDVVGTKAELNSYPTGTLTDRDIVKVLNDESQDGAQTYYRWSTTEQSWTLVGKVGPCYTKSEADGKFATITDLDDLSEEVTNISNDVANINVVAPLTVTTAPLSSNPNAIAIGLNARATSSGSVVIGANAVSGGTNTVSFGNTSGTRRIVYVTDPINPQDAATKHYVDEHIPTIDVEHDNLYTQGSDKVAGIDAIQNSTDGVISATNKLLTQQSLEGINRAQTGTYLSHSQSQNEDFPSVASVATDPTYRNGIEVTEYDTTSFIIVNEGDEGRWAYYRNAGNTGWERAYQITDDMQSIIDQLTYYRFKSYTCNNAKFEFTRNGNTVAVKVSKVGNQNYTTPQESVGGASIQLDDDFIPELRTVVSEFRAYDGYKYTWQQAVTPCRAVIRPKNHTDPDWIGKLQVGAVYYSPSDTTPNPAMEFSGYFTYSIN